MTDKPPKTKGPPKGVPRPKREDPPGSFPYILKAFHSKPGRTRKWAAEQLCVPITTYNLWCSGKPWMHQGTIIRLIELIDEKEAIKTIDESDRASGTVNSTSPSGTQPGQQVQPINKKTP